MRLFFLDPAYGSYDVELEVAIAASGFPAAAPAAVVSRSNFKHMYWNARQQLVHHTVTGCAMRPGDLLGSGTISGPVSSERVCARDRVWGVEVCRPVCCVCV